MDYKERENDLKTQLEQLKESQKRYEFFDGLRTDKDFKEKINYIEKKLKKFQYDFVEYLI